MVLAKAIKKFRVAKGITQAELANRSGFDPKTISRFETGEYVPTVEAVYKFAEILGVPVKEFFADFEEEVEQRAGVALSFRGRRLSSLRLSTMLMLMSLNGLLIW